MVGQFFTGFFFGGPTPMNSNSQQTIILKTVLNHYLYKKIHGIMLKKALKITTLQKLAPMILDNSTASPYC